jgi:hypothetical protein
MNDLHSAHPTVHAAGGQLIRYGFEDAAGSELDYMTGDYDEARDMAFERGLKVIEHTYDLSDSALLDDFTRTGEEEDDGG